MLIEWIWTTLDTATTPRLTESWFAHDLAGPIGLVALAVTIAMMLASAIQAALAGRPEQILDAFKHGAWSIAASVLCVTVDDLLLGLVDAVSNGVWMTARGDLQHLLEGVITVMQASALPTMGFLAVLLLLFMYLALIGPGGGVGHAQRADLHDRRAGPAGVRVVGAADDPRQLPQARAPRRVADRVQARDRDHAGAGREAHGQRLERRPRRATRCPTGSPRWACCSPGIVCFAVASITPLVLYKLMPTVEGAVVGAGVAGGWGRGAMTGMYGMSTAKNLGGSVTRLASRPVPSGAAGGPAGRAWRADRQERVGQLDGRPRPEAREGARRRGGGAAAAGAAGGAMAATGVGLPLTAAAVGLQAVRSGLERAGREAAATTDAASTGSQAERPTGGSTSGSASSDRADAEPSRRRRRRGVSGERRVLPVRRRQPPRAAARSVRPPSRPAGRRGPVDGVRHADLRPPHWSCPDRRSGWWWRSGVGGASRWWTWPSRRLGCGGHAGPGRAVGYGRR